MEEIVLHIDDQQFTVSKELLMEHSDYFRAMFSGNFIEKEKKDINIDVVDANSMDIIVRYMNIGLIDLSEFTLPVIAKLATAANFLQITELTKQIEYCLDLQLSLSNWVETMSLAQQSLFTRVEHLAATFGLLSFKLMKPEFIPSIDKLFWYLSHPYLDTDTESDVFKFGYQWITNNETGADALLIIIGSLDLKRLDRDEINYIIALVKDYENSLAEKVLQCIKYLLEHDKISLEVIEEKKEILCKQFTERVYNETCHIVRESKERRLKYTPVLPVWMYATPELDSMATQHETHFMYTFTIEKGFEKWLEVAEPNLWGWKVTSWGPNRLVVVCGEFGRGMGVFMKDVKVYDTLRKEWTRHGAQLPSRRHSGVAVLGDSLFIIGGVGSYRVVQDSAIVYDLKQRTYREIAKFPEAMQGPAVCAHKDSIYAAAYNIIYKYEDLGETDRWKKIITTHMKSCDLTSHRDYIYCSQKFFSHLYVFQPEIDETLTKIVVVFPTVSMCSFSDRIMLFHSPLCGESSQVIVTERKQSQPNDKVSRPLWNSSSMSQNRLKLNDAAGSATLVLQLPIIKTEVSKYHQNYISRYLHLDSFSNKS